MKIDDINKKNIHKVPDKFFDELPMQIQSRIAESSSSKSWVITYGLRFALPAILLLIVTVYLITKPAVNDHPEQLLAEVSTEELIAYLDESDITTEELVDHLQLSGIEFEFETQETDLVDELDFTEDELDALINDFETEDIL